MSRRKQPKPQQLRSDGEAARRGDVTESAEADGTHGGEEMHICERCCAQFPSWSKLSEHQGTCTEDPLVLIVKDSESVPLTEESSIEPSPAPSSASSDSSAGESADAGFELGNDVDGLDNLEEENMELEHFPQEKYLTTSSPRPPDSADATSPQTSAAAGYSMPSTNVTLEILHSTRVAVAQFSQGISSNGPGGKAATAAIPVILEHLLALQQQQVHQLQLIEQICSQVAVMNRQPTQAALNPAARTLSFAPNPLPAQGLVPPPILPLSGTMPSAINGQAAVSLSSVIEKSSGLPSTCGQTVFKDVAGTSGSSESTPPSMASSSGGSMAALLPPFTGTTTGSISSTLTPSSPQTQSSLLSSSSSLPFLPQSPPSSVIFPNPLASIAATTNALDPLAALMKHRKGKLPNVSLFETKPGPEEPFFKHKCRFCAKVFGSDSALQIHLRSHTGERPFKCNICGNRFSTKGNLKVHFQRHKEKYPHVQMNPFPVPEYLDNCPTSSGIPYGMSFPPEKPASSWLDSKPVVATLPASMGLPLSSTIASLGGSNDPVSVTPSVKSPYQAAPGECVSVSPSHRGSETRFSPVSESPKSNRETEGFNILKPEGVPQAPICPLSLRGNPANETTNSQSLTATPELITSTSSISNSNSPLLPLSSEDTKFLSGTFLDSMQTSETSKLQQLVENIDKKITDPNQCVLCHRVLSCQSALRMHYRTHTGERPFKCRVCGRAFTTKGNLKTHVSVHRENPPVQIQHSCPICQQKFTNAVVLQEHIRMHMVGNVPEATHEMSREASVGENLLDSLSSNGHDDVSMEDYNEEEDEEVENMEEGVNPLKLSGSDCGSPPPSASSIAALETQMKMIGSAVNPSCGGNNVNNGFHDSIHPPIQSDGPLPEKRSEHSVTNTPTLPEPSQLFFDGGSEGAALKTQEATESQETVAAFVKREQPDSPSAGSASEPHLRGLQPGNLCLKEEPPHGGPFPPARDRAADESPTTCTSSSSSGGFKAEVNAHPNGLIDRQHPPTFSLHVAPCSPGMTSLIGPAPARRMPKQHNCKACGKNFSSASALQIHERTHTGEKPFVCSVCGRAFTTKGNLKVHMGTHMWNNTPARRGRRLSMENPMALLGGEALKFGEMFQKDLAARAMNVDPGFWNRYAAAITNSLAMKTNEISVIQSRGLSQLHPLTAGMDRLNAAGGAIPGLTKSSMDLGNNRHFSMLIDDSKEIGIN